MSIFEIDHNICPICGATLFKKSFLDQRDSLHVECQFCGKYAITDVCYEDKIDLWNEGQKQRVSVFLKNHKSDQQRPFISCFPVTAPEGYKNYVWSQVAR